MRQLVSMTEPIFGLYTLFWSEYILVSRYFCQPNNMKKLKIAFLSASIIVFAISLFQDCFCTNDCINSFSVLITGIFGIIVGGANLCWLANPLLLVSWIFFYFNTKVSFVFSLIASLISFMFIFSTEVAIDEAGTPRQIENLEFGYWLWLFSMLIILIGNSAQIYFRYSTKKTSANS